MHPYANASLHFSEESISADVPYKQQKSTQSTNYFGPDTAVACNPSMLEVYEQ